MIVDKHTNSSEEVQESPVVNVVVNDDVSDADAESYDGNPLSDIYRALEEILKDIRVDPDDPNSPRLFKTVKYDCGQVNRIKNSKSNEEYGMAFPAVFIHLINIRWLVATNRIGEGRADLRIRYVLNRLNNGDDAHQTEGYDYFQTIINAIENNKSKFSVLTERLNLTYFDPVETFENGLQQFWITYEVWFRNYSTYRCRNYVDRYLVIPPFTNHSDQLPESNPDNHDDHDEPTIYDTVGWDE